MYRYSVFLSNSDKFLAYLRGTGFLCMYIPNVSSILSHTAREEENREKTTE